MLKRSLFIVALACGCSFTAVPAARGPIMPAVAVPSAPSELALGVARPAHARRVARLAPPFAASGLTRRVPDGEPMTALATTP